MARAVLHREGMRIYKRPGDRESPRTVVAILLLVGGLALLTLARTHWLR